MKRTFISIVLLFTLFTPIVSSAQTTKTPQQLIGNWLNSESMEWEYGFYPEFAVWDTDFWEYKQIEAKRGGYALTLSKGDKELKLRLRMANDTVMTITAPGTRKALTYLKKTQKGLQHYATTDTLPLPNIPLRRDSVVIRGFYRGWEKVPVEVRNKYSAFKASASSYYNDENAIDYRCDIDSVGRFECIVPVTGFRELALHWEILGERVYVEPGEVLMMCADISDLLKRQNVNAREAYWLYDRDVTFMGRNARYHNENSHCGVLDMISNAHFVKYKTEEELFTNLEKYEAQNKEQLAKSLEKFPTLSYRYRMLQELNNDCNFLRGVFYTHLLNELKQKFFVPHNEALIKERIYRMVTRGDINQAICSNGNMFYWWIQYNKREQIIEFRGNTQLCSTEVSLKDLVRYTLQNENDLNDEQIALLNDVYIANKPIVTEEQQQVMGQVINDFFNSKLCRENNRILTLRYHKDLLKRIIPDSLTADFCLSRAITNDIKQSLIPLSPRALQEALNCISSPIVREELNNLNEYYIALTAKNVDFLRGNDNLSEFKEAKALFEEIIKPYRGKVIYMDIWGTWCDPCCENMLWAKEVKEALKGEDVVFLYLANRSPEESWKKVISRYDITGDNVIHHRLPEEQQSMLERLLNVNKFPTYVLIDKDGKIVNPDAKMPMHRPEEVVKDIRAVLTM
ncbi:MAG: TlpA family protein disulfide reductase [Marinifilaceae bacterium]